MSEIILRAIESTDLPDMKRWRNDIIDMCREYRLINDEHQDRWWQAYSDQAYERYPKHLMYAIEADSMPRAILGVCGWTNIDWLNRRAELSIYLGTEYQNKGHGRKALRALHDIAFNQLGFQCVWLEVHDWNPNARKLYETEGYQLIGKFRDARFKDGKYYPTWIYDFTVEEYRARQDAAKSDGVEC